MNHRYVRTTTPAAFDALVAELRAGGREAEIPAHGTLVRVRRGAGALVDPELVAKEREAARGARAAREAGA